jgi:hypothetical protein
MISEKREEILDKCKRFDEVLKIFNDTSGLWDVKRVLSVADSYEQLLNKSLSK